jgi:hypothetical protein
MMDGDLQHDPADIPRFLAERSTGADLIASYRAKREETLQRKAITAIINHLNRALLGIRVRDFGSAFRLIRMEIIQLLKDRTGYVHYNTPELFIKARRYIELPIAQARRKSGSSKWTLLMFVMFNLDILVTAMRPSCSPWQCRPSVSASDSCCTVSTSSARLRGPGVDRPGVHHVALRAHVHARGGLEGAYPEPPTGTRIPQFPDPCDSRRIEFDQLR